jgi:hypothetical protein
MTAIAGECLAQIAFAAFGPEWPRTSKHRTALRWLGFQPLHGAHEMFAETAPFLVAMFVGALNARASRLDREMFRDAGDGGDDETLLPTSDASSGAPREGINERNDPSPHSRGDDIRLFFERRLAMPLAAFACVVAGVANPSVAAAPYFFICVVVAVVFAFGKERARRRTESLFALPTRYRPAARLCVAYASAHFALVYAFQLPEINGAADKNKAEWLGLRVLDPGADATPGAFAGGAAQAAALAVLFVSLCNSGALRGMGGDENENGEEERGEGEGEEGGRTDEGAGPGGASLRGLGGIARFPRFFSAREKARRAGFVGFPLARSLDEPLLDPEDGEWVESGPDSSAASELGTRSERERERRNETKTKTRRV